MSTTDSPRKRTASPGKPPDRPTGPVQGREFLPLDQFITASQRTRDLNEKHVVSLADSIAAIGLIHPPAVDRQNRLLAGAHRLAALRWLNEHAPERFAELFPKGVPAWRMDLNANSDVDLALAVEISENEQRRDYSSAEILRLAERLKAAGFYYSAEGGRPRTVSRPLLPALEFIVGKSVRQLRRILNPSSSPKTRPRDLVSELERLVDYSARLAESLRTAPETPEVSALKAELGRVDRLAGRALAALKETAPPREEA